MEVKVRVECPMCKGEGLIQSTTYGDRTACPKCVNCCGNGTGTVERWLPITDLAQMLGVPQSVVTATLARVAA